MSQPELEKRVVELEARVAFQDDTIGELNDVVVAQRTQPLKSIELSALSHHDIV